MSSNSLHITRSNYEEYFLLYVDGELAPEQCDAVEAFAALHPDLQEELDMLLTTKLEAEEPVLFDKSALMADQMKATIIDENLLLFMDNELKGQEKERVEKTLVIDSALQEQYQSLLQTRLPAEALVYPYKKELYRHTAMRPVVWFRVAAAVFVLLAMGFVWWMQQDLAPADTAAVQQPVASAQPQRQPAAIVRENNTGNAPQQEADGEPGKHLPATITPARQEIAYTATPEQKPVRNESAVTSDRPDTYTASVEAPVVVTLTEGLGEPQQIINKPVVTTASADTYNTIEAAANEPAVQDVAVTETTDKKGSLKGFLRKATRLIERHTGINPTNGDEEVLIGAVALKLK